MVRPDDDPQWYLPDNGKVGQAKPDNGNTKTEPDNGPHKNHNGEYFIENPRPDNGKVGQPKPDNGATKAEPDNGPPKYRNDGNVNEQRVSNNGSLTTAM